MKISIGALLVAMLIVFAMESTAATAQVYGVRVVNTLLADNGRWGGCMAQIDRDLASEGLACPGRWISFSCTGDFTTKDVAYKMFESAQMAHALGFRAKVVADDSRKHNGYYYANSIEVFR